MIKVSRIIEYSVAAILFIGFVLTIVAFCIGIEMGSIKKRYNESAQAEIVARIDSFYQCNRSIA